MRVALGHPTQVSWRQVLTRALGHLCGIALLGFLCTLERNCWSSSLTPCTRKDCVYERGFQTLALALLHLRLRLPFLAAGTQSWAVMRPALCGAERVCCLQ